MRSSFFSLLIHLGLPFWLKFLLYPDLKSNICYWVDLKYSKLTKKNMNCNATTKISSLFMFFYVTVQSSFWANIFNNKWPTFSAVRTLSHNLLFTGWINFTIGIHYNLCNTSLWTRIVGYLQAFNIVKNSILSILFTLHFVSDSGLFP